MKLAAILRLADALDRSHERRIWPIEMKLTEDSLVIACPGAGDLSLERLSLENKGDMFEDVYGLKVRLISPVASRAHTRENPDD
jgi:exopolyphosphatase/guanosine-5'-triphosphate,3'-diphosphate pyrophosphatase